MRRLAMIAVLGGAGLAIGCGTAPSKPKPTAADVVIFKHEARILGDKAALNAPWSGEQLETIRTEVSSLEHHIDQLADAAGIGTQ